MTEGLLKNINNDNDIDKIKKNIAIEIKNKNQWMIEYVTQYDETIRKLYIEVLKDIEKYKETPVRKRVVVVSPEGDEKIYPTVYRASKELEIHPSIISFCCKGERYVKTGKSKKDGKKYSFHYEGETPQSRSDDRQPKYIKPTSIDKVLSEYNRN